MIAPHRKSETTEKNLAPAPIARAGALAASLALALSLAACGTAPATGSGADAGAADEAQEQQATISVSVTVDGSAAGVEPTTADVELPEGSSAYDALVATGADVNAQDSQYGMYVMGIDGLASGDHGDMSGWLYSVNGEEAEVGCSEYELEAGDVVTWTYVTEFAQE